MIKRHLSNGCSYLRVEDRVKTIIKVTVKESVLLIHRDHSITGVFFQVDAVFHFPCFTHRPRCVQVGTYCLQVHQKKLFSDPWNSGWGSSQCASFKTNPICLNLTHVTAGTWVVIVIQILSSAFSTWTSLWQSKKIPGSTVHWAEWRTMSPVNMV